MVFSPKPRKGVMYFSGTCWVIQVWKKSPHLDIGIQVQSDTLRITRQESIYGYVAFETKRGVEAFVKGNAGIIRAEE